MSSNHQNNQNRGRRNAQRAAGGQFEQTFISQGILSQMDAQALISNLEDLQELETKNTAEQCRVINRMKNLLVESQQQLEKANKYINSLEKRIAEINQFPSPYGAIINNLYLNK